MKKRIIALALALLMAVSLLPTVAFATPTNHALADLVGAPETEVVFEDTITIPSGVTATVSFITKDSTTIYTVPGETYPVPDPGEGMKWVCTEHNNSVVLTYEAQCVEHEQAENSHVCDRCGTVLSECVFEGPYFDTCLICGEPNPDLCISDNTIVGIAQGGPYNLYLGGIYMGEYSFLSTDDGKFIVMNEEGVVYAYRDSIFNSVKRAVVPFDELFGKGDAVEIAKAYALDRRENAPDLEDFESALEAYEGFPEGDDVEYEWEYINGGLMVEIESKTDNFLSWLIQTIFALIGNSGASTNHFYYLAPTDIGVSSDPMVVALTETVYQLEHQYTIWTCNNDGTHSCTCINCGDTKTDACRFTEANPTRCIDCGSVNPEVKNVKAKVTMSSKTTGLLFKKKTVYTYTINVSADNTDIKKVEYSLNDGKLFLPGVAFTSISKMPSFKIRVTDSDGMKHVLTYPTDTINTLK